MQLNRDNTGAPCPRQTAYWFWLLSGVCVVVTCVGWVSAILGHGPLAWVLGACLLSYDVLLVVRMTWLGRQGIYHSTAVATAPPRILDPASTVTVAALIAAKNEEAVIVETLQSLLVGPNPPDEIMVIDDHSRDGMMAAIDQAWPLTETSWGWSCATQPLLRIIRGTGQGKATALNDALVSVRSQVVVTLDADTRPSPESWAAIRAVFTADPDLVAGCGILEPDVQRAPMGLLAGFQRVEYMRSFLWRAGWAGTDSLVLVSGAFAAFRLDDLRRINGFDADCLVEDYEVMYRLHTESMQRLGRVAKVRMIPGAQARTEAPGALLPFLAQRRRWFAGFITVLWRYRWMVGFRASGRLGCRHLLVKTVDIFLPWIGVSAWILLGILWIRLGAVPNVVWQIILVKMAIDVAIGWWGWSIYRQWLGRAPLPWIRALPLLMLEPLIFQPFRQVCAVCGWMDVVTGRRRWGQRRG